MIPDLA
jgi:hypothetical protein